MNTKFPNESVVVVPISQRYGCHHCEGLQRTVPGFPPPNPGSHISNSISSLDAATPPISSKVPETIKSCPLPTEDGAETVRTASEEISISLGPSTPKKPCL